MFFVRPMPNLPRRSPVPASTQVEGFPQRRGWRRQANIWFAAFLVVYGAAALWLALDVQYIWGDALSRTQAALSAVHARYPGLGVIGFVFTPLTTVLQIPLVALSPWIPELTRYGLAGAFVSVAFMAGAVRELWLIASERNVRHWVAVVGVLLFALNPMIIAYGATGMSEAPFIYATLWSVRRLIRWTSTDGMHDLVVTGFGLALAFLARYDALIMAFTAMWTVGFLTWRGRARRHFSDRFSFALIDMLVLVGPIGLTFLVWIGASWLTTGELLAQFTSQYGNSAIIAASGGADTGLTALFDASFRTFLMSPALIPIAAVAIFFAWRRRDPEPLVPLVMMLSVLFFQIITYTLGSTFGMLRFFLTALPLTIILLFQISPPTKRFPTLRPGASYRERVTAKAVSNAFMATMLLLTSIGYVITTVAMTSPKWAPQEYVIQTALPGAPPPNKEELLVLKAFSTEAYIAEYLDSLELGDGEVLVSTVFGYGILTASTNQKQFVIPSDDDFVSVLNDPIEHGVKYILTMPFKEEGENDPINLRYPRIYETGNELSTIELDFKNQGASQPDWRLYQVLSVAETS